MTFPASPTQPLPELREGRDGTRQLYALVNQMRRRLANLLVTPGGAKLSFDFGPSAFTVLGGSPETMVWQRPIPYGIFGSTITVYVPMTGAKSASGTATLSVRVSPMPNNRGDSGAALTGTVVGSVTVATLGYTAVAIGPLTIPGNAAGGEAYLQLTITPGAGTAEVKEGGATLS